MVNNFLTTLMTRIVLDKSTDNDKPHSICLLTIISKSKKVFFSEREQKKALRDILTRAALSGLYRQRQISQSGCEIRNCGKSYIFPLQAIRTSTPVFHVMLVAFGILLSDRVVVS